jgi:Mn2+/Fe2+ NRAMP family transporter
VLTAFFAHPHLGAVVRATVVPHVEFSVDFMTAVVAVLGTTISPYLFFWQASSEVDEMKAAGLTSEAARRGVKLFIIEAVFSLPGIGKQAIDAIGQLDIPMIMGTVLFAALLIVLSNIAVDLSYALIDPRIRYR